MAGGGFLVPPKRPLELSQCELLETLVGLNADLLDEELNNLRYCILGIGEVVEKVRWCVHVNTADVLREG